MTTMEAPSRIPSRHPIESTKARKWWLLGNLTAALAPAAFTAAVLNSNHIPQAGEQTASYVWGAFSILGILAMIGANYLRWWAWSEVPGGYHRHRYEIQAQILVAATWLVPAICVLVSPQIADRGSILLATAGACAAGWKLTDWIGNLATRCRNWLSLELPDVIVIIAYLAVHRILGVGVVAGFMTWGFLIGLVCGSIFRAGRYMATEFLPKL